MELIAAQRSSEATTALATEASEFETATALHTVYFAELAASNDADQTSRRQWRHLKEDRYNIEAALAIGNGADPTWRWPQRLTAPNQISQAERFQASRQERLSAASELGHLDSEFELTVRAHAEYFAALSEREGNRLNGSGVPDNGLGQRNARQLWHTELENIYEALDTAQRRRALPRLLVIGRGLGEYLYVLGDFLATVSPFQRLLELACKLDIRDLEAEAAFQLGRARWRLGNYAEARSLLEQSLVASRELGDERGQANALGNLGCLEFQEGNYPEVLELQSQSCHLFQKLEDRYGEANALNNLGLVEDQLGNYAEARRLCERSLATFREIGDRHGEAHAQTNLAQVEYHVGNYGEARGLCEESLAIRRELGDRYGEAYSLYFLGSVELQQGNNSKSAELQEQSLAISREVGDRQGEAYALHSLGDLEYQQGSYAAARRLQEQSLAICRELGDRYGEAYSLNRLGVMEYQQENYARARSLYRQSLAIFYELGNRAGMVFGCVYAAVVLGVLDIRACALAISGSVAQTGKLGHALDSNDMDLIVTVEAALAAAVAAGEITADRLARWRVEGEALSLEDLVEFTLAALRETQATL